jgi:hypothetical protein
MKRREYVLSSEELSFALAFCRHDGLASSVLKESTGEVAEEGIELILQTASRSLFSKGILLNLVEERPDKAFTEGFKDLLDDLASSNNMFRAYNENENGQFVLTSHSSRNGFILHIVSNQIVHVLCEMELKDMIEEITAFFQPRFNSWDSLKFSMEEDNFQSFIQSLQSKKPIELGSAAEQFASDFYENEGNIVNFSLIRTENDGLPNFLEVVLLLTGKKHTWTITEEHGDGRKKIIIKTLHKNEWDELFKKVLSSMATNQIS